jgi:hypothetical protein
LAREDLVADFGEGSVERYAALRSSLSFTSIDEMKVDLGLQKSDRFPHLLDAIHPVFDRDP